MSVTVKVSGLKELQNAMMQLGRKTRNRIAVKAMRQGGAIVRDKARQIAPVLNEKVPHRRAGTLKKAISSRTKIGRNGQAFDYAERISDLSDYESDTKLYRRLISYQIAYGD